MAARPRADAGRQPRRGRAGNSTAATTVEPTPNDQLFFDQFRLGKSPNNFGKVQLDRKPQTLDQFLRSVTPNTGPYDAAVISDAMAALFDKIGPAVLFSHSQAGGPGWLTATKSPNVKAIVAFEPGSGFIFPQGELLPPMPSAAGTLSLESVPLSDFLKLKRVLVTAKGESALAVLQEKLPERIRPLSVALLFDERDGMKQFEHSIETIASSVASINPTRAEAGIAAAEEKLNQLHAKISHVDKTVAAYATKHMSSYQFEKRSTPPYPRALQSFACLLGTPISEEATPHLNMLLRRAGADAGLATYVTKRAHQRRRPFVALAEPSCTPKDEPVLAADGSYPSGHAAAGWAWGALLAGLAPSRSDALLQRGRDFGNSRMVCAVHWASDVEAGRLVAAATLARLEANATFRQQRELA